MECSDLASSNHVRRLAEIVPNKGLHIRLNDDVRLSAPCEVRMPLNDVERAAENIGERARLLNISRLQIDRDDDVRAQQEGAFDGNRRSQKTVYERAIFILDRHKQSGISAGSAKRRSDCTVGVVDGYAGNDVRGGNGHGDL